MSLPRDLLVQARQLAYWEPKRPKQASLRRAVSSAYYALFHRLLDEASRFLVSGTSANRTALRNTIRRGFGHGDMKKVSNAFRGGTPPHEWQEAVGGPIPPDLVAVADAFIELQHARHEADYDRTRTYFRHEVTELVRRCEQAFRALDRCKRTAATEAYLTALLVHRRLRG